MAKYALPCALVLILLAGSIALAGHGAEAEGEAAASEGGGLFSGTFGDSLWTVLAFVALLLVLGKFAWKPLLNSLIARQTHIEHQLRTAEDSRLRAEKMLDDYKQQGLGIIRQAAEQGEGKILANFREIPVPALKLVDKLIVSLRNAGIGGVLAIGEIGEPICQIPVDINRVGMILYGGLNPVACAHETGVEVENRAMSTVMDYQELQNFWELCKSR